VRFSHGRYESPGFSILSGTSSFSIVSLAGASLAGRYQEISHLWPFFFIAAGVSSSLRGFSAASVLARCARLTESPLSPMFSDGQRMSEGTHLESSVHAFGFMDTVTNIGQLSGIS